LNKAKVVVRARLILNGDVNVAINDVDAKCRFIVVLHDHVSIEVGWQSHAKPNQSIIP
jgi:hypothetical protein